MSKIKSKSHQMCCVVNCSNKQSKTESIKLFRFPSKPHDIEQRKKWIHAVKRKNADNKQWEPTVYSRICSSHFIGGQYSKHPQSPAYSPTLFPIIYKESTLPKESNDRFDRHIKRSIHNCSTSEVSNIDLNILHESDNLTESPRLTSESRIMVKKRKSVLISSAQVVDSPMKEPRIIRGNHLEKARNSLNEALDIISKKEQKKKAELATENDVLNLGENDTNKKLKKNEVKQEVKDSLVLKLRDRSIDLASFTDNTAMYPICRAWIKNDPLSARQMKGKKSENLEHSFKSENESSTVEDYVYKLPPPKDKSEVGLNINHRTPTNLPKDVVTTLDTKINNDEIPNLNELLNEHRKRWACVRQEWIKFSNENEARYTMSKSILNSMLNKTAYNRTMEKQPDKPEDVTNDPLPSMSEPMEVQDAVASTLAMLFPQPIIAASKSKAQKQREYRQRIAASRTPAQVAAARKSKNERQRNNRLRQAANLAIASGSLETTTTSSSRSGEESNNVQTRSQRQHALQQSITTADQPDERVNLTNEPLFLAIPVPMEVQEAVASTSATPFAEPITAAPKTRAQIQREYRQRIAASKTPAQAAAAREARNVRDRNNRLRHAANLVIASGSLEATTTSSSRSGQRLTTVHIDTQRQFT